ncbi:MAG: hypothetical protein HF314_01435 [Ignavibacteria bacterium]|jgi:hypothetical protein|nr:hypothetical protein [Ignavibacteria bacterium]MCU7501704.1 hypothetical protein [Ignavibacteria bacterium]MCU7516889.1 hypothetical protein [Ignavibacteria bacterium]
MSVVKFNIAFLAVFLLLLSTRAEAQTCGFGCLGLGGFYAGFNIQNYKAEGFNDFIRKSASSASQQMPEFGKAKGFRVGANIFRTKYNNFIFSTKGYYQFLKEENQVLQPIEGDVSSSTKYTLNLNYYGVGVDFGYSLGKFLAIKLVDAQVTFHSASLTSEVSSTTAPLKENDYSNDKLSVGYSLGSGLIFRIVGEYISLEATAGYTKISVGKLVNDTLNSSSDEISSINNFVSDGGLFGLIQLNVGIPLY